LCRPSASLEQERQRYHGETAVQYRLADFGIDRKLLSTCPGQKTDKKGMASLVIGAGNAPIPLPRRARSQPQQPPVRADPSNKVCPSMLASSPASMLNQNSADLGIPNRIELKTSRYFDAITFVRRIYVGL
jgi:hypothetical protein